MARTFNGSSDHATFATGAPITSGTFSVGGWIFLNATGTLYGLFVQSAANDLQLRVSAANKFSASFDGSNVDSGATTLSASTWYHVLATYAGSGAGQSLLYVNGVQDASATRTANFTHDAVNLGSLFNFANFLNGRMAEWAAWGTALTANEALGLARGARPHRVRGGSLLAYWPLWGLQSPEPDLTGKGFNLTLTGTAFAAHAPVTPFTGKSRNAGAAPPPAPVLSVTAGTNALNWTSVAGATSYNLYRGGSSGSETLFVSGITGTGYTDGSQAGVTSFYEVTAVSGAGESPRSNEVQATTPALITTAKRTWHENARAKVPLVWRP